MAATPLPPGDYVFETNSPLGRGPSGFRGFIRKHWQWLTPVAGLVAWHIWALTIPNPGHVLYRQWAIHWPWDLVILLASMMVLYAIRGVLPGWLHRNPLLQAGAIGIVALLFISLLEFDDPTFDPLAKSYADWLGHLFNLGFWGAVLKRFWWNVAHQLGVEQVVRQEIRRRR